MKCTFNATLIILPTLHFVFLSKSNTLWIILRYHAVSFSNMYCNESHKSGVNVNSFALSAPTPSKETHTIV